MPRPTFTASEVARYVYCNLAWSYDVLGAPTLSAEEVRSEAARLRSKTDLSAEERQDLAYLQSMEHSFARRDSGERYHASLAKDARAHRDRTRRVFLTVLAAAILALVLYLLLS